MTEFRQEAEQLLERIGGKDNIQSVSHCATRMRFALVDPDKADMAAIEALPSVKGTFTQAGQFQVIIGNQVSDFYLDFEKVSGISGVSKAQVKQDAESNQNIFQRGLTFMAEVFAPIIPAFIVGGLILGFRNILGEIPFDSLGGQTITDVSQFWAGVNDFLWLPGEAIFHFLPVMITWSVTRKMGTTEVLGIILGITLVSPQLLNAYGAPDAILSNEVPIWDFGNFTIDKIGYQAQVLPALFAGLTLGWLEKFWRRVVPEYLSMILVPFLSLLPAIILAHTVLGPIGWRIGTWIGNVVFAGLTSGTKWLFGLVFGAVYAPLVITGLHHMTNAVDLQLIADYGGTQLWPMIALSNIAQGAAVVGYWWLTRKDEKENQISIPSFISAFLGVTEPAMFGITLKHVYPFVAAMIGSGLAGMYSVMTDVTAKSIGVGGLPGFLVIQPISMLNFWIAMAIALIVPFALTLAFYKSGFLVKTTPVSGEDTLTPEEVASQTTILADVDLELVAVADGDLLALDQVNDQVFSAGMMGQGYGLNPSSDQVVSPVAGRVVSVFDTKHAIGIETDNGVAVLIHMGLDTVELQGGPFQVFVSTGDIVDRGTPIAVMDREAVEAAGKETTIVTVVTNMDRVSEVAVDPARKVAAGDAVGQIVV